ncbi:MAG: ice-binding family protein [Verrucomicrobiota bacterium]
MREVGQLFNTLDHSPFHERDLHHDAEEFILSWVREFPINAPVVLVVLVAPPAKWSTGVTIPTDVSLSGGPNDVWIFQIAGNLTLASAKAVLLSGGAQATNIFWQVAGGVGVALGTTSHFEGILLVQKAITLQTGASINGKLLAQTAVTLDANIINAATSLTVVLRSSAVVTGPYNDAPGQSVNLATKTITVPMSGSIEFYRIWSDTPRTLIAITLSGGNVVITYN